MDEQAAGAAAKPWPYARSYKRQVVDWVAGPGRAASVGGG